MCEEKVSTLLYASQANDSLTSHSNRTDSEKVCRMLGSKIPSPWSMHLY